MNRYFLIGVVSALLAQPAAAITFPSLTTIYVGAGVYDSSGAVDSGTIFRCANVSGQNAAVRFLVLNELGNLAGAPQVANVPHGASVLAATESTIAFSNELVLSTGTLEAGAVVNIESTQSGVFCNAVVFDPDTDPRDGSSLPLVRVNPHPGTAE